MFKVEKRVWHVQAQGWRRVEDRETVLGHSSTKAVNNKRNSIWLVKRKVDPALMIGSPDSPNITWVWDVHMECDISLDCIR